MNDVDIDILLPPPTLPVSYGEQDENVVDLSLIRYQLSLTPRQHAIAMNKAARDAYWIFEHGRRNREDQAALFQPEAIRKLRDESK